MNDYYRIAKAGEVPTHYFYYGGLHDKDSLMPSQRGTGFVKLGWFSPEVKPEKEGSYLVVVKVLGREATGIMEFNTKWTSEILAWGHLP